ncbi:MAG: hypothetical protein Q8L60_13250 [Gammaproteobacteria bacterium]|nr:hypothetical protein [Gammaproteobacteria bacterium]MDP2140056.1 hypothetical protein [Gammaproteobacteria bacterium]MDP2347619.1 hypothetical protein [Gammaproteobacteria bacterium]
MKYTPPFTISPTVLNLLARISEAVGRLSVEVDQAQSLRQRRDEIMAALGLSDRMSFSERYLRPALAEGLMEMTIPDKPRSPMQRYRLTAAGMKLRDEI